MFKNSSSKDAGLPLGSNLKSNSKAENSFSTFLPGAYGLQVFKSLSVSYEKMICKINSENINIFKFNEK